MASRLSPTPLRRALLSRMLRAPIAAAEVSYSDKSQLRKLVEHELAVMDEVTYAFRITKAGQATYAEWSGR